jgi:hypothetical protein
MAAAACGMSESPLAPGSWSGRVARLQKLRSLTARELAVRARYRVLTAWERSRHPQPRAGHLQRLERAIVGKAGQTASTREWLLARGEERRAAFLPGVEDRPAMQSLFRAHYRPELETTRQKAQQACNHCFEFFGKRFAYDSDIDWHADPQTGRQWPRVYHQDVPIHDGTAPYGDVKYVWELNRHQFLTDLGKLCFLQGGTREAAEAVTLVRSWIRQNPPGTGVNWACALEPAFRALSWLWTYHFCLASQELDAEDHLDWLAGFHDHGEFLFRHLELYSSPYNHLIGEAAALYALGALFPEFHAAGAWRRRGRHVLEAHLEGQFYRDGGSVEQSTFYHHATLGFYLFAALIGRANNEEFADSVWRAIERGIEFSMHLTQPDGCTPSIGGADDGKPIRLEHGRLWDFRAFQAAGAVLFTRPDMKHVAGQFPEDALWLLGPSGRRRFESLASWPPRETAVALDASGYFVARNRWTKDADYLCFDCGEQADSVRRDDVPNAVHGHADCLAVTLWLGGRAVLVDPGVYCYNGDPSWVGHFRGTGAHNTLRVDGRDQSRYHGKMSWSNAFDAHLESWRHGMGQAFVMGHHDGYARSAEGVVHRRAAWLRPDSYAILWDEVVGAGAHSLELRYQFAAGDARLAGENCLQFDGFAEVGWVASVETTAALKAGGFRPADGWIAPSLGIRQPAPVLVVNAPFRGPRTVILTVAADRTVMAGEPRVSVISNRDKGVAIAVRNRHSTDWIVSGDLGQSLPFRTDARLAVWRVSGGRIIEACSVDDGAMHPREGEALIDLPVDPSPAMTAREAANP